jgi:uncharacterized protein YrzB (UPF0473 family)
MKNNNQPKNEAEFTLINADGKEIRCEVLFTFDSEDFHKSYIVYTDHSVDEFGVERVYASIYDPSGKDLRLQEIKTKAEWEMIDHLLNNEDEK